ncbi:HAD-like domain-containing protein [Pilobolus umbonatus]|nr:HAD-like domain-containing protein [Pilobolus umbonatus]
MCCTFSQTIKTPVIEIISEKNVQPSTIDKNELLIESKESEVTEEVDEILDLEDETVDEQDSNIGYLLDPIEKEYQGRKCLVLDLDETLIHSSFKSVSQPDFTVAVEIDGKYHNVFVLKRPGVDEFMKRMGEIYEIVIFTASLSKYADPVLDSLDLHRVVKHRLFREACQPYKGNYIKDLSRLGRDLKHVIILDNTPASYCLHEANAVPVSTWFNDQHDSELMDLVPFLEELAKVDDVVDILDTNL